MKTHPKLPKSPVNSSKGFALVVSLTMLVLLTIIAVGLLSLSAITLRTTAQTSATAEAQANARLALMIAIGELQKNMGPDQRISARGATLAAHPAIETSVSENSPQAWWVGASHSNPDQVIGSANQPVVWLISGLNPSTSPTQQLSESFSDPVALFTDKSIDTSLLTGGRPIEAGKVAVMDEGGNRTGSYAYFIDDNGMKAQLAATNPAVRNELASPHGGGVLPGTYDLGILDRMNALAGTPMEQFNRLVSINDLPLIGLDTSIVPAKRMSYTALSRGVLADVRKGGLKRDLTIAFEDEPTFDAVFPKDGPRGGLNPEYLVVDPVKQTSDMRQNGYIHWRMFHDYYNLKKHIYTHGGVDVLDPVFFNKLGFVLASNNPLARGQLGPHQIGDNTSTPVQHQQLPYGNYPVMDHRGGKKSGNYRHSPVFPVLQRLQQNAWLELIEPPNRRDPQQFRTHVQLWTSHYNPYNITLRALGNQQNTGPRIIHFPQVRFTVEGVEYTQPNGQTRPFSNISGLANKRQSHVNREVILQPGRSHVLGFRDETLLGGEIDSRAYGEEVRDLTLESVYGNHQLSSPPRGSHELKVDFFMPNPTMGHGVDMNPQQPDGDHEVSQAFSAMIAWNAVDNVPGKTITKTVRTPSEFSENNMASHAFQLRTTREPGNSLRPLIDANIRAQISNPKWDSPLGLPTLAGYSAVNDGEVLEPFFQMSAPPPRSRGDQRGVSYWGAGDDAMFGFDQVVLFDIPRMDLVSLGQLQHANVGRFSYEPSYIVGNSYANPRIPLNDWSASVSDTFSTAERGLAQFAIAGSFDLYDASYLVNEELWDSYIFTTIPQVADNHAGQREPPPNDAHFSALLKGDALLPNPRFLPYEPSGSAFDTATLQMPSTPRGQTGGFYHNAGHLMVDGAFNVNSTSVDAWEAFLSGTHGLPVGQLNSTGTVSGFTPSADGVRFPRVQNVMGTAMETDALNENYWIGFRKLTQTEVRELAEAIVAEIQNRGPFLSLGEFVNRKLENGELGRSGALQAALDATINQNLDSRFEASASHRSLSGDNSQGAGFPGQLLQGDILQALSPYMTVRSDNFTIRAYGESIDAAGNVIARAWCEAVVQRFPDAVPTQSGRAPLLDLSSPQSEFGRVFRVISFRWLNVNEV